MFLPHLQLRSRRTKETDLTAVLKKAHLKTIRKLTEHPVDSMFGLRGEIRVKKASTVTVPPSTS